MAPQSFLQSRTPAISAACREATWPKTTSEWPLMALVSEETTTSAPRSSGRWPRGVGVVLSTTTIAPACLALATALRISQISRHGLHGGSGPHLRHRAYAWP